MAKAKTFKNKPRAKYAKGAVRTKAVLSQRQIYLLAREHGARPLQAVIASAVVMAESGGRVRAFNGGNANGTWDAGLGQINQIHGYSREHLMDPNNNMRAIKKISNNFTNWGPWVAYNTGAYRKFMAKKDSLLNAKGKSGVGSGSSRGKATGGASGGKPMTPENAQTAASFAGGLPGTELAFGFDPSNPLAPFFGPFAPSIPDSLEDIVQFPTAIEDSFRLFNHLFEAKFWYRTGKVALGVTAILIGINALLKISTKIDPVGTAKKGAATAASIAATKKLG